MYYSDAKELFCERYKPNIYAGKRLERDMYLYLDNATSRAKEGNRFGGAFATANTRFYVTMDRDTVFSLYPDNTVSFSTFNWTKREEKGTPNRVKINKYLPSFLQIVRRYDTNTLERAVINYAGHYFVHIKGRDKLLPLLPDIKYTPTGTKLDEIGPIEKYDAAEVEKQTVAYARYMSAAYCNRKLPTINCLSRRNLIKYKNKQETFYETLNLIQNKKYNTYLLLAANIHHYSPPINEAAQQYSIGYYFDQMDKKYAWLVRNTPPKSTERKIQWMEYKLRTPNIYIPSKTSRKDITRLLLKELRNRLGLGDWRGKDTFEHLDEEQ